MRDMDTDGLPKEQLLVDRPTAMRNSDRMRSGRLPMEFSQNMAGRDPTRENKLKTLSPKIALFPTPRPKVVMICGPNV